MAEGAIRRIAEDLTIIKIEEVETDGTPKHWHYFDVIATKS